jgi:hypothetical protein
MPCLRLGKVLFDLDKLSVHGHPFPPDRAFPADDAVTLSQPLSLAAGLPHGHA